MSEERARITGIAWIDKPLLDFAAIPSDSLARRALLALLVGVGFVMTGFGSIFIQNTPMIPYGFIPDLRFAVLLGSGLLAGAYAAGGGAHRRGLALWMAIGIVLAFHLEEATVHWIGPYPGSITGARVGLLGTAGSILALAAVLLLHVEVEHVKLAEDLEARGVPSERARRMAARLGLAGARRVGAIAAGVAGLALLVRGAELVLGNDAAGGAYILLVGAAGLLALGAVLWRLVPKVEPAKAVAVDEA